MDQEIKDTIKAFVEGEYGVTIGKDEEANDDQTDQIAVQVHALNIPNRDETMVRAAEKTRKRKLAIANWDWENVVNLTNFEDGPDADEKAGDFYATDNDNLYDSDSDELVDFADSVLCFKPSGNQYRLTRHACRQVILD
ncbi:hypothetical protein L1987_66018 [Smallanthus sonchifolius]|uniref:Uncharacterized protein n=1 Tax=Smallanthus sonchifolius TaxID=185202 RepID=A0ACB9BW43_9ASTR|nr:hypothetical protein L1987_66018 [Smallanthus sonchifolius]